MEVLKAEKILVIQTAFIGDAVLTLPMIQKLKELFPESRIDVVSTPVSAPIFNASPCVDSVYPYDKKGKGKSLLQTIKFGRFLKKNHYTRIYSPHRSFRSAIFVLFAGVKETFGFSNTSFHYSYKHLIEYIKSDHEVKRNLSLIGYEGDWKIYPQINPEKDIIIKVDTIVSGISPGNMIAAVAPGSVWETKKYPKEKFIELINALIKNSITVLLIGGNEDKNLCDDIASGFGEDVISTAGRLNILESIELLKRCRVLISNDSAPTHFGICAGIPVLTIYCSTIPDFGFYPYSEKSTYISYNGLKCKPCGIHGLRKCPINTFDCANLIEIELIKSTVIKMMKNE